MSLVRLAQFMIASSQDTLNMPIGNKSEPQFVAWWEEQFEIFLDIAETSIQESPPSRDIDCVIGSRIVSVCKTIGSKSFDGFCRAPHTIEIYRLITRHLVDDLLGYLRRSEKQRIMESN